MHLFRLATASWKTETMWRCREIKNKKKGSRCDCEDATWSAVDESEQETPEANHTRITQDRHSALQKAKRNVIWASHPAENGSRSAWGFAERTSLFWLLTSRTISWTDAGGKKIDFSCVIILLWHPNIMTRMLDFKNVYQNSRWKWKRRLKKFNN